MGLLRAALVATLGLSVPPTLAAEPTKDVTVAGITLGQPLGLPKCQAGEARACTLSRLYGAGREMTEVYPAEDDARGLRSFGGQVRVETDSGVVVQVWVKTRGVQSQNLALQALKGKFGPPTSMDKTPKQNGFGARFDVIRAEWARKAYHVQFYGALGSFGEGAIIVRTAAEKRKFDAEVARKPKL